jgi:uroporphyrinogen decarboxylase
MNKESLFLNALACRNTARAPVWIMRQAGRYMPSYKRLREKYSLEKMFHTPELIEQVTLLPIDELNVDAAIVFSDILLPFEALGCKVVYENDKPPRVLLNNQTLESLALPSYQDLKAQFVYLQQAFMSLKKTLRVPLIGFCGAPFTLASYLLESSSHHLMRKTKTYLYQHPEKMHQLLALLTDLVIEYAKMQIEAGAEVIQLFDSWAGVLDTSMFNQCCVHYLKKIVEALRPLNIPIIIYARGSCVFANELAGIHPSAISFDWQRPLEDIAKIIPSNIALQGNLDPDFLRAPLGQIEKVTREFLKTMRHEKRFILNLGHGVLPDLSYDAVKCFVETALACD